MEKNTSDQHCSEGEWSVWHWTVLDPNSLGVMPIIHRNATLPKCLLLFLYMHISFIFHKVV